MSETPKPSYEVDMHVHIEDDAKREGGKFVSLQELVEYAKGVGLDGVCVTTHDNRFFYCLDDRNARYKIEAWLDRLLNQAEKHGIIVVPSIEFTARHKGKLPHIMGVGIDNTAVSQSKKILRPWWSGIEDTVKWIHDVGGLSVAAHPLENPRTVNLFSLSNAEVEQLAKQHPVLFDAIETVTPLGVSEQLSNFAREQDIAPLGGSDAHQLKHVGIIRTGIFGTKLDSWRDVIEAVKRRQVTPFIAADIPPEMQKRSQTPIAMIFQHYTEKTKKSLERILSPRRDTE